MKDFLKVAKVFWRTNLFETTTLILPYFKKIRVRFKQYSLLYVDSVALIKKITYIMLLFGTPLPKKIVKRNGFHNKKYNIKAKF